MVGLRRIRKTTVNPELIDRIYECSFVPELWPKVLGEVGRMSETAASLFITNEGLISWTASRYSHEGTEIIVKRGLAFPKPAHWSIIRCATRWILGRYRFFHS
jgi:hypothetical protein